MKTNAVRILERLGVEFELRHYEVDASDLSAPTVAAKVGLDPAQVFKTLATRAGERSVHLAVVPGDATLDLKALARAVGEKKLEMLPLKDVQRITGYVRGAVTALGAKRPFPVWLDRSAERWPIISVSAGVRGTQILLAPADYRRATEAQVADLTS